MPLLPIQNKSNFSFQPSCEPVTGKLILKTKERCYSNKWDWTSRNEDVGCRISNRVIRRLVFYFKGYFILYNLYGWQVNDNFTKVAPVPLFLLLGPEKWLASIGHKRIAILFDKSLFYQKIEAICSWTEYKSVNLTSKLGQNAIFTKIWALFA